VGVATQHTGLSCLFVTPFGLASSSPLTLLLDFDLASESITERINMADFRSEPELQQPAWLHRHWLAQLWGIHNGYAQGRDPASVGRILPWVTTFAVDDHCVVMDWHVAKQELTECAHQMMFVSGETAEPSTETTGLIEEIVRAQVIDMVRLLQLPLKPLELKRAI
jgi:hypothetical protein